jgi:hypothetical protein
MGAYRFLLRCSDCRKTHRKIFALPGGKRKVVRELEEAVREVDETLTNIFEL